MSKIGYVAQTKFREEFKRKGLKDPNNAPHPSIAFRKCVYGEAALESSDGELVTLQDFIAPLNGRKY